MSLSSLPKQSLPNELLSYIVLEALRSPRLSITTDQLFIQPKCKIAFQSLSKGFGGSCRKFRTILLREWFRVFHAYELVDIEQLLGATSGGVSSVSIKGFVRELYFHQTMGLLPPHFKLLQNLHTISYPLRDSNQTSLSPTLVYVDLKLPEFPESLQGLELRDALCCSPEEIRSIGISMLINLTRLKISCGETGAWGPVPSYGTGNADLAITRLAKSYLAVLSPLAQLRAISLDVHLSDVALLHNDPSLIQPTAPLPAIPLTPVIPQAAPPIDVECTGDNLCLGCWEARRAGSQHREVLLARILGKNLRWLESIEWTIWHREEGRGEEKRRVTLDREASGCPRSSEVTAYGPKLGEMGAENPGTESLGHRSVEDDIVCMATRIPLAMYPAILG